MMEPPVFYLEAIVSVTAYEMAIVFGSTGCPCLARRVLSNKAIIRDRVLKTKVEGGGL
jgi:hypothetical protein